MECLPSLEFSSVMTRISCSVHFFLPEAQEGVWHTAKVQSSRNANVALHDPALWLGTSFSHFLKLRGKRGSAAERRLRKQWAQGGARRKLYAEENKLLRRPKCNTHC